MAGQYNLKASVVLWSANASDFDVIIRRTKNETSDVYAPTPSISYLSCLSLDDSKILSSTADILRSLPAKLASAEDVQRASPNPGLSISTGIFIIDEVIRLLEFYGQLFGLKNVERGEKIRRRPEGLPLQVFEASSGSMTSSVVRTGLTVEEFQALNLSPSNNPNDPPSPDFKGRLENLMLSLSNCSNYLRENNWDVYRAECRNALTLADMILSDADLVAKVAVATLQVPPERDRNAEFSDRFRAYVESLYAPSSKSLVERFNNELNSASRIR